MSEIRKVNFFNFISNSLTEELNIPCEKVHESKINCLGNALLEDPLYPSVSKIFEPFEISQKHFLDSLAPLGLDLPVWKNQRGYSIVDLGTGGGFPALPLAIFLNQAKIYAVDSRQKSVGFVDRMAKKTQLTNVVPVHSRIEDLGREKRFREKIDLVVCRALASVRVLIEYCFPLIKVGGHALFYKGPKLVNELEETQNAFKSFFIEKNDCRVFSLGEPHLPFDRAYLLIQKRRSSPLEFPRKSGIPSSRPL